LAAYRITVVRHNFYLHTLQELGTPIWMLREFKSDLIWLIDREDSPWFSVIRLFKQNDRNDWTSVILKVKTELEKLIKNYKA
jgi:hypothetical protein